MQKSIIYSPFLVFLLLLSYTPAMARETILIGKVFDNLTKSALVGSRINLLNATDSCLITSCYATKMSVNQNDTIYTSEFGFSIPNNKINYIIQISDYEYESHFINIDNAMLNAPILNLGNIYLKHKTHELSEVTVTASKVKFYNKGDTVVFNADAFIMAEGSMLDALIKQLPGVELHTDGRIYINGRFIDNLILNGKDFFKGNNNVMLENLGAYTVKNIKVYERLNTIDKYIGQVSTGSKEFVMDVQLKKDYMDSWIVNFMFGYGFSNRYIGRLFLSRFTPRSRISLFTNSNNINENRKPGEGILDWSPSKMETGTKETLSGGIDYFYDFPDNIWKLRGDVIFNKLKNNDGTSVAQTNFTQPHFTYNYTHNNTTKKNIEISTKHTLKMEKEYMLWWLNSSLNFKKWDTSSTISQAAFSEEQLNWSTDFIRNIYSSNENIISLINRKISNEIYNSHRIDYNITTGIVYKIPKTLNVLLFETQLAGYNLDEIMNDSYSLNFASKPDLDTSVHRLFNNHPNKSNNINTKISYTQVLGRKASLTFDYQLGYTNKNIGSDIFALNDSINLALMSPSYYNLSGYEIDVNNSYIQNSTNITHTLSPGFSATLGNCWIQVSFPVIVSTDYLRYKRGDFNTSIRRTSLLFEQKRNSFIQYKYKDSEWFASVTYTTKAPDLLNMIDITDTTNPLVIEKGNPELKNSGLFKVNASYSLSKPRNRLYTAYVFDYEVISNALAKGYTYDSETGVKTFKTYNVNGNRNISGTNYISYDFGSKKSFSIKHSLTGKYIRSVDIIGVDYNISLNKVNRYSIVENLSLSITHAKQKVTLTGNVDYSHFTGDVSFNTIDFHYGVQGVFKLPYGIGIDTDFTVYCRRGYQDKNLNTNNYVWNTRISYSLLKGNLLLSLDGYDIFHNLSNIFYSINAQGRTETYRSVLPRYFMIGLQWKFNTSK